MFDVHAADVPIRQRHGHTVLSRLIRVDVSSSQGHMGHHCRRHARIQGLWRTAYDDDDDDEDDDDDDDDGGGDDDGGDDDDGTDFTD